MKVAILGQICSPNSIVRVIFAAGAIGMDVDIPNIHGIIKISPPCSVKQYFEDAVRADRDGKQADAT